MFLGEDNSVKLGDFGLSKMIKSHDFASTYVGTPFYMSPEICAAEKYTLKSDIWSLGCIIYELCTREPPFNAKTHLQLVQKIKEGRFAPLPDMYSPELSQVVKNCLKVNSDRRPDTAELLNLPVVKLMRKEKEVVDLNKTLRSREEALQLKENALNERIAKLDKEKGRIRDEQNESLRLEWEVRARLEIDRRSNDELEKLKKRFDEEVQARVDAEVSNRRAVSFAEEGRHIEDYTSSLAKSDYPRSSTGASGDEFPSTTDISEYSIESVENIKEPKKSARTPFGRAQTMFVGNQGTPMDIEMASPSPMAIASLSLSPRRNGATKAPSTHPANIFAANAAVEAEARALRWEIPQEPALIDSDEEDRDGSPTRNIRSSKNPFTSKTRPVLTSQKSLPINRLQTQTSNPGFVSKLAAASAPDLNYGAKTPGRRLSKIPSATGLESTSSSLATGLTRKLSASKKEPSGEALGKVAAKNNIRGRTLVELQQARAGGRPLSSAAGPGDNTSPKRPFRDRIADDRRRLSVSDPVATWDPEKDEMPSPFLVRQRRCAKA